MQATVRSKWCIVGVAFGIALVGISASHSGAAEPEERLPAQAASPDVPPSGLPNPIGILRLPDALAAALAGNGELTEFAWELRAEDARIIRAGLRPNPHAALIVEDVLGTGRFRGARESQTTLEVSQLLELGGKRSARVEVAERSRDVARADYELKRAEVAAEVARRFIRLLAAEEGVELVRANTRLAAATVSAISKRVKAGAGSPLEEKKAQIAVAHVRIAAEHAEHVLAVERRELAALWGSAEARFDRAEGNLFERRRIPAFETLSARLSTGPAATRNAQEMRLRETETRLAGAQRVPGLTIGAGTRHLEGSGDQSFLFTLGLPLPVSDRNQGGVAAASALLGKAAAKGRSTELRLRTVLFGLHQELSHAAIELDALEHDIVPRAEESLTLARSGFGEGRFSYLELLDSQRTLTELRRERIDAALAYQQFVLEIERLIGGSIDAASALSTESGTAEATREESAR